MNSTSDQMNQVTHKFPHNSVDPPRTKSCQKVHIEDVLEYLSEPAEAGPPPGLCTQTQTRWAVMTNTLCTSLMDDWKKSEPLKPPHRSLQRWQGYSFDTLWGYSTLALPRDQGHFCQRIFGELLDWKKWDHVIELIPNAQSFRTKVYPLALVEQKQLEKFLDENLESWHMPI